MRKIFYITSLLLILAGSGTMTSSATEPRIIKPEVAELFSLIIHSDTVGSLKFHDCQFSSKWSGESISKENIKKYLKLIISSDITPTSNLSSPMEYLKLAGVPESAICDKQPEKLSNFDEYGFPIFNSTHSVALMTNVSSITCWAKDNSGKKVPTSTGGSTLLIFKRTPKWKLVDTQEISNWDGIPCAN